MPEPTSGVSQPQNAEWSTEREKERAEEDEKFVPVIVKRSDAARRHPDDTLQRAIEEGREQLGRRFLSLFLSALAAGLILGFTAMPAAVVMTATQSLHSELLSRLCTAFVYPLGFVVCILSGAQLFTEHTATAVYPVLDRKSPAWRLVRLWLVVICGNLLGAAAIAGLLRAAEPIIGAQEGYAALGRHLIEYPAVPLLVSAMLAGWLMAQGAWLVLSTPSTTAQILAIYLVTFVIGIGGLHHSVAGSVEMLAALFITQKFTVAEAASFTSWSLLGNLIGGSTFVAMLNYAHIRRTQTLDHASAEQHD